MTTFEVIIIMVGLTCISLIENKNQIRSKHKGSGQKTLPTKGKMPKQPPITKR